MARAVPTADRLAPLVLLTILATVLVQGGLSGAIAAWLGFTDARASGRDRPVDPSGDGSNREAVAS